MAYRASARSAVSPATRPPRWLLPAAGCHRPPLAIHAHQPRPARVPRFVYRRLQQRYELQEK